MQIIPASIQQFLQTPYAITKEQIDFWNNMLKGLIILDFNTKAARQAAAIVQQLKIKRKSIDKPDLFIAATAIANGLILDTTNKKHFEHIEVLNLLTK